MTKLILPALLAAALVSCVVVAKQPASNDPPPPHNPPPPAHKPPPPAPSPWPPGAPPLPAGMPWYHDKLEHKYDAGLDACYDASKKALGIMKFTASDQEKRSGVMTAQLGSIWARCSMYRKNHHTYVTFYFRVHGHRADARMPEDFARRCQEIVAKEVKEAGNPTGK